MSSPIALVTCRLNFACFAARKVLKAIAAMETKYNLRCANVFHAGDGNMHPCVLFDPRDPGQTERTRQAALEIMEYCIAAGGSITGEHGVGADREARPQPVQFSHKHHVGDDGIVTLPRWGEQQLGGHCMDGVGYRKKDKFIKVKNSWGEGWGVRGHCWVPFDYLTDQQMAADFWTIRAGENI